MKLYCFVILIFISVIFTVGEEREWGNGGIGGVYSLPTSTTNQSKVIPQPLLVRRSLAPEDTDSPGGPKSLPKHPSETPIDNDKPKHGDGNNGSSAQSQNADDKQTAEKLEEEAQTIKKVIVVLCSLGASLILVAIAIAVLYWKVRRQQQALSKSKTSPKVPTSRGGDIAGSNGSINDEDNNINSNIGNVKRNSVSAGVGETSDSNTTPLAAEKIINNSDLPVVNGVAVCDKGNDGVPYIPIRYTQFHNIPQQLPPSVQPSAPPEEKLIGGDNGSDNNIIDSNIPLSTPHLAEPPAYSPTAPPVYDLPHIPILEFDDLDDPMELYINGSTQQQNSHILETNSHYNGIISPIYPSDYLPPNNGVWYAAGPTLQTDTSVDDASNQQSSHSTIIHSSSTVDLNSSSNLHENNDDDKPTHQRHNSSTI